MTPSAEAFSFAVGLVGGAFALVRYALAQNRLLVDRFATHLERQADETTQTLHTMHEAIDKLAANVRDHTAALARLSERGAPFGGDSCSR